MKKFLSAIAAFSLIFLLSTPVFATDATWNGSVGDGWSTGANWTPATAPGTIDGTVIFTDTATFTGSSNTAITVDNLRNVENITFDGDAGGFTLTCLNASDTLLLTSGGAIQNAANTHNNQNINTKTKLNGVYTFNSNASNNTSLMNFGGSTITQAVTGALTLGGNNTGNNTISAILANGAGTLSLDKIDAGTWILSGANTYTGATIVSAAGTLQAGVATVGTTSGAFGVGSAVNLSARGATLSLNTFNNTIGSLNGLAGSSVNLGTAILTTKDSGTDTFAGVISGGSGGGLTMAGTGGTLILSGANTYTGITTITAGTLQIGDGGTTGALGTGNVVDNSALRFDRSDAITIANAISGTGTLEQFGTGTLTINTANTSYSGTTTVTEGTLQIGDAHALGTGAVTNNSILDIGATNLVLGNTYTQNTAASTLNLAANSSSSYGNITSTGHAAVVSANSTVNVTVGGYIPNNTNLTIINTGGSGINGTGAPTTVSPLVSQRVHFTSSISNNNLILTTDHSSTGFASLANNLNAQAVGVVLDNVNNPSSDMTIVLNTLEFLSNAQTTSAFNTMTPTVDAGVLNNSNAALNNFVGASLDRAQSVLTLAAAGNSATGISTGDGNKLNGIWAKGYGSYLDQGTRNGIQGYTAWNTGTAIGVDRLFSDVFTLGVSGGYAYGKANSAANNAKTNITSGQGTIYAGYQDANIPYFIDAAGSFAWNWYKGKRDITVGAIDRTANADYQGQQYGAYLGGGYKFKLGKRIELTPLTSIQWNHLRLAGYTEADAGSMNLSVNRQSYDLLQSGLGASVTSKMKYKWGNFSPEFHAKWLYNFIGDAVAITSTYTGGGGSFASNGVKSPKNSANIGGKLSFDLKNDISLIAECDTQVTNNFFGVYGSAAVRYKF